MRELKLKLYNALDWVQVRTSPSYLVWATWPILLLPILALVYILSCIDLLHRNIFNLFKLPFKNAYEEELKNCKMVKLLAKNDKEMRDDPSMAPIMEFIDEMNKRWENESQKPE